MPPRGFPGIFGGVPEDLQRRVVRLETDLRRLAAGAAKPIEAGIRIATAVIEDLAVTTAKLAERAVTTTKIALSAVTDAEVAAANKDGAAGTPSLRTLGSGAAQAAAGNDARLSDQRVPTDGSVTDQKVAAANKDGAAGTPSLRTLGSGAAQAAAGNDARLSDQRVPTDGSVTRAKIASGVAQDVVTGGATSTTNNQTEYFHPVGLRAPAAAEDAIYRMYVRRPCKIRRLRAVLGVNFAGPNTVTVTFRKNGADTALTVTFAGGNAGDVLDDDDEVSLAAGDYITVKTVNSGAGSGVSVGWSVELEI